VRIVAAHHKSSRAVTVAGSRSQSPAGDFGFIFIFHSPADGSLMSTVAGGGFSFRLDSSATWLRLPARVLLFPRCPAPGCSRPRAL
jgi:hypothetical protein